MRYLLLTMFLLFPNVETPPPVQKENSVETLIQKIDDLNHDIIELNAYINENLD